MATRLSLRIDDSPVEYKQPISQKVALGIAVAGPPTWALHDSIMTLKSPKGFTEIRAGKLGRPLPISQARDALVEGLLALPEYGWLLQLDQDAILHPETLMRLMSWDVPIISPLVFARYPPIIPVAFSRRRLDLGPNEYDVDINEIRHWIGTHKEMWTSNPVVLEPCPLDALVPQAFVGTHCLLVRRDVFETIDPPWFKRTTDADHQASGCDRYFCQKAIAAGYPIYMDRSVVAGHMYGERSLGALDFLAWDAITDWETKTWVIGGKDRG